MLKLLLDEHISPDVAKGLRRRNRAIEVRYMVEWENGYFLGQDDYACLREAAAQGLTLVTYDRRTNPPLASPFIRNWAGAPLMDLEDTSDNAVMDNRERRTLKSGTRIAKATRDTLP
jgi:hypothetical protein